MSEQRVSGSIWLLSHFDVKARTLAKYTPSLEPKDLSIHVSELHKVYLNLPILKRKNVKCMVRVRSTCSIRGMGLTDSVVFFPFHIYCTRTSITTFSFFVLLAQRRRLDRLLLIPRALMYVKARDLKKNKLKFLGISQHYFFQVKNIISALSLVAATFF